MAANPAAARSGGVERVAAGLAARGFGRGDVLALSSPNLPEYALALYGAMAAGGAVTGANPLLTAGELAGQLADAGASALVTVPPFLDLDRAAAEKAGVGEVLVFGEAEGATPFASLLTAGDTPPHVRIDPVRDLAALPYSSGTTGLPKGVELTHANLVANARQSQAAVGFTPDDVVVGVAPFFHAMGQNLILPCSLRAGATVVSMPSFDLAGFLGLIQDHRATCTIVPAPTRRPASSRSPTWPCGPGPRPRSSRPGWPSGSRPSSGSATSASSTRSRGRPRASCCAAPWSRRSGPAPDRPRRCASPGAGPPRRAGRRRRGC
jgi:acyl-coenzyme A synthetase/AMP-(fatty) acid ligase